MLKDNLCIICFLAGIVLCLLFAVVLPNGVSPAWGCWLYILAGVLGASVCRIEMFTK